MCVSLFTRDIKVMLIVKIVKHIIFCYLANKDLLISNLVKKASSAQRRTYKFKLLLIIMTHVHDERFFMLIISHLIKLHLTNIYLCL